MSIKRSYTCDDRNDDKDNDRRGRRSKKSKRKTRFTEKLHSIKALHDILLSRVDDRIDESRKHNAIVKMERFLDEITELEQFNDVIETHVNYNVELSKVEQFLNLTEFNLKSLRIERRREDLNSSKIYDSCIPVSLITYFLGICDGDCIVVETSFSNCIFHLSQFSKPPYNGELLTAHEVLFLMAYDSWIPSTK